MNMLAAAAEAAMWPTGGIVHLLTANAPEDRGVVDVVIEELPERMGDLAERMAEIYRGSVADYLADLKWSGFL
jgi:hypothetical protein